MITKQDLIESGILFSFTPVYTWIEADSVTIPGFKVSICEGYSFFETKDRYKYSSKCIRTITELIGYYKGWLEYKNRSLQRKANKIKREQTLINTQLQLCSEYQNQENL
jgi:hypothetical protein